MTINKFNYEAFALDYLEGKLSVELTEEMERFLATHPAIETELSGMMEVVYLEPDTSIVFEDKAALLKEEKVVWLNRKWAKPLMAAASVALLLMTYFSGYQAGIKQGDNTVVVTEDKHNENRPENSAPSVVATIEKEETGIVEQIEKLPTTQESELEKTVARFVPKTIVPTKNIREVKMEVVNKAFEEITIEEPTNIVAEKIQVVDNEGIEQKLAPKEVTEKEPIILTPIASIQPKLVNAIGQEERANNLSNALKVELPVAEMAGITIQKRKRGIKDFLGRFPVTQLKEALIPTYYKEENAGQ